MSHFMVYSICVQSFDVFGENLEYNQNSYENKGGNKINVNICPNFLSGSVHINKCILCIFI